ncbi:GNAT family N-acetyltransferase [Chengkuizengella axinellae]|uniref:GNAT family N-acetyltransferase n=1 Tax=Chengkuizengella axinellae TaxID=3064388 RepID=A0ABT9J2C4_9BACL|nr:GNAT family N-acetyltransferase [Chengkuizengella sp. 2205SS18-9]MDP5275771.1 GNAT family N-acetyltransferase [Chengkuizengella sp. 2205SS18-9]
MSIQLREVSKENWYDCTQLNVSEEQLKVFSFPVVYWIAESKYDDDLELRAVYSDDEIVGFIVYSSKPDQEKSYWIMAFMIDEKYQGKGYGKVAMEKLIEIMHTNYNCKKIMLGHRPNNFLAASFYESLGFKKKSDELIDGETVRVLVISDNKNICDSNYSLLTAHPHNLVEK